MRGWGLALTQVAPWTGTPTWRPPPPTAASRGRGGLAQPQVVLAQERQALAWCPRSGLFVLVLDIVLLVRQGPELTTLLSVRLQGG